MEQHPGGDDVWGEGYIPDSGVPEDAPDPNQPAGEAGEGRTAGEAADRLTTLTHELGGLLDGSLRWLGLVSRSLGSGDEAERVRGQLVTVQTSLERMGELVRTASGVKGPRFGFGGFGPGPSVAEAAHHAADVIRPRATELGITLGLELEPESGTSPAGPLYSVLLNGLRNAIESIEQALGGQPGEGMIALRVRRAGDEVVIEIEDDGIGPPVMGADKLFEPGFSTRAGSGGGRGIGLSLSKRIVSELGGTIELRGAGGPDRRPGAVLLVRTPLVIVPDAAAGSIGDEGSA